MAAKKRTESMASASRAAGDCWIDVALVPFDTGKGVFGPPVMIMRKICTPPYIGCPSGVTFGNVNPGAYAITVTPSPCSQLGGPYYLDPGQNKFVQGTPSSNDLVYVGPDPTTLTITAEIQYAS
jgi:hypothetical protein